MAETRDRDRVTMENRGARRPRRTLQLGLCAMTAARVFSATASARTIELHNYTNSFMGADAIGVSSPAFSAGLEKLDVDNSSGAVLVATDDNRIYRFNAAGASQAFSALAPNTIITGQGFGSFGDLEIDNSGTATQGRFYAFSEASPVQAYEPSGEKSSIAQLAGDYCGGAVSADGHFWTAVYQQGFFEHSSTLIPTGNVTHVSQSFCDMDMDTNGFFYVHQPYQSGPVYKYSPTGESLGQFDPGPSVSVAIDRSDNDVYVDDGTVVNRYTSAGQLIESFGTPSGPYAGMSSSQGIGVNANSHAVYVTNNASPRAVDRFTPSAVGSYVVPDATTEAPTAVTRISATMHGAVKADGVDTNSCKFEWGPTYAYANSPVSCAEGNVFTGSSTNSVSAPLAGLTKETEYHYRLVVENVDGKKTIGNDQTFFTQGAVTDTTTKPATDIGRNTATLNGSFDGEGLATNYWFEYGETKSYGTKVPLPVPPGAAVGPVGAFEASQTISGLTVETLYHYRIVAENTFGSTNGGDLTFSTLPAVAGVSTDPATNIGTETADLNASFTGDGLDVQYYFEWGATTAYGAKTPLGELTAPSGPTALPPATLTELQPLHHYHYRVVISNSTGTTIGPDLSFVTVSAPSVVALSSSHVTATTADLRAVVNPHGVATEYHFEYGTTTDYGAAEPVPDGTLPATESGEPVEVHLTGLNGGVYHFRVVASSKYGVTNSIDQTFNFYPPVCPNSSVRQQSGSNTLPDCRAYELVTPEDAGITIIYPASYPFSSTATAPSRLVFGGSWGSIENVGDPANYIGDSYVATRTDRGWKTKYVGLPSSSAAIAGGPPWTFLWQQPSQARGQYGPDKWVTDALANPSLSTLVDWNDGYYPCKPAFCQGYGNGEGYASSNAPYVWDSNTGKQVDRWPTNVGAIPGGELFKGRTDASADLSHFIFTSNIPFAVGGEPGDLYDNDTVKQTVTIISLKGSGEHITATPVEASEDGSHILMTVGGGRRSGGFYTKTSGPGELYMSVNDAAMYEIAPGHAVNYLDMTPDGQTVYFTSNEDLTEDHSDLDTSRDLYMWSESTGKVTLLSEGNASSAGNSDACSASWTSKCDIVPISFASDSTGGYTAANGGFGGSPYSDNFIAADNGDIYFLSPELLHGSNGVANQENLYVYRGGKVHFVASLEPSGRACVQHEEVCSDTAVARMEVTPDDDHMAFLTGSKVTGYESAGHSEMYLYTPATDEMTCVSCLPSGAPPTTDVTTSRNGIFLTNDGRTFFETGDALVPQDTNEAGDVYEFVEGRPQLITSGTVAANNTSGVGTVATGPGLVGVSADGTDVYFSTYDVLVGQDRNGEGLKIYDARSGGGFQFTPPVPPCVAADECHGPSSAGPGPTPSGTGSDLGSSGNVQQTGRTTNGRKPGHKKHKKHRRHAHHEGRRHG